MGIDVYTLPLWAELARWQPHALEVIVRPEHWAIHGTTRMGKALTHHDRVSSEALDETASARGVSAAKMVMEVLSVAERTRVRWEEPVADEQHAPTGVAPEGMRLLAIAAHALQAGAIAEVATARQILALVATPPQVAERPTGPWSAILAMDVDTLWIPAPLESTWDSPFGVVASAVRLREDLERLPRALRTVDADAPRDLLGAQRLVEALREALETAGASLCVRMSG